MTGAVMAASPRGGAGRPSGLLAAGLHVRVMPVLRKFPLFGWVSEGDLNTETGDISRAGEAHVGMPTGITNVFGVWVFSAVDTFAVSNDLLAEGDGLGTARPASTRKLDPRGRSGFRGGRIPGSTPGRR